MRRWFVRLFVRSFNPHWNHDGHACTQAFMLSVRARVCIAIQLICDERENGMNGFAVHCIPHF